MRKISEIDFEYLSPLVKELDDFNRIEVREYLDIKESVVGDESVEVGHYLLDVIDIIDDVGDEP